MKLAGEDIIMQYICLRDVIHVYTPDIVICPLKLQEYKGVMYKARR